MMNLLFAVSPYHRDVLLLLEPLAWQGSDTEHLDYIGKTDLYLRIRDVSGGIRESRRMPPEGFIIIDFADEPYDPHDTPNVQSWRLKVHPDDAAIEFVRDLGYMKATLPIYMRHRYAPHASIAHYLGTAAESVGTYVGREIDIKAVCTGESVAH